MSSVAPTASTLEGAGCRLRVYDYGNSGAEPLMLVHGMQDFALALEPLAEALCRRYRVVACDLRGHGDSDKPGVYTMGHFLADLHALLFQLEMERPVLVGHSLGSQIVCQYAGVFADVPAAVVSIDGLGPPVRAVELDAEERQWRTQEGIQSLLRPAVDGRPMADAEDAVTLYLRNHPRLDRERAARLIEGGCEPHPHGGLKWKWDPRVGSVSLSGTPELAEERFSWVRCPALLLTASEVDEFWMRRAGVDADSLERDTTEIERKAALFRHGVHVEVADSGHHIHYDNPDELIRIVGNFLDTL